MQFRAPQEKFTALDFIFGRLLGLGSYSKVILAKKKDTMQEYALKVMEKSHIIRERKVPYVKMERIILDQLDHPGVSRLMFTFQDSEKIYMAMECCYGGELFDQITRKGRLSVEDTRFYTAEIVDVLEYIHNQGLVHRDIKPENLLLTADGHIKLCDFGSAKMLKPFPSGVIHNIPDERTSTLVGTAEYVAPEILKTVPVSTRADLWALGCVIYQMLDGKPPFKAKSEYLTFKKVMSLEFNMQAHFPPEAKDLISQLLRLDPEERPNCEALKSHPFFNGIDWNHLWESRAPALAVDPVERLSEESTLDDLETECELPSVYVGLSELSLCESSADESSSSSSFPASPVSPVGLGSPIVSAFELSRNTVSAPLSSRTLIPTLERSIIPASEVDSLPNNAVSSSLTPSLTVSFVPGSQISADANFSTLSSATQASPLVQESPPISAAGVFSLAMSSDPIFNECKVET